MSTHQDQSSLRSLSEMFNEESVKAEVNSANQSQPKDKENADSELSSLWTDEAAQAHKFRNWAFWGGFLASVTLFLIWLYFMLCFWPEQWYTTTMVVAFGPKVPPACPYSAAGP